MAGRVPEREFYVYIVDENVVDIVFCGSASVVCVSSARVEFQDAVPKTVGSLRVES